MADLNIAIKLAGVDAASGPIGAVSTALGHLTSAAGAPVKALGGLGSALGAIGMASIGFGALVSGVSNVASGMISGNAQMETYETQLGTLMGSADKAREELAKLAKFGAETPFELPEIVRAEKVLLGFGLTGEKVFRMTGKNADQFRTVVGDVAAGTGANFEEIALTFGKFSAGATGEAISRFQELGVATREQMADLGIEFSKSGELLSPLPIAMQAIVKIAQEKFGGGMDKLSKTTSGQLSTLADNFNQAKNKITASIFTAFGGVVASVNEAFGRIDVQAMIQRVADALAGLVQGGVALAVEAFGHLQAAFMTILPTLQSIYERVTTFFGALASGQALAVSVNKAFGDLIPPGLNPILDAVDAAFGRVTGAVASVVATLQQGGLAGLWQQAQAAMAEFAPTGERIQGALAAVGQALMALVPQPITDFVAGLFATARGATDGAGPLTILSGAVNAVSIALEAATRFVRDHVAVQAILVGALGAAVTAWGISLAVQAYATAVGVAGAAVRAYTAVQAALNIVLTANPIGLVIVAIAALTAGLIYAYQNSETFRDAVDGAFAAVKDAVQTTMTVVVPLIASFAASVVATATTVGRFVSDVVGFFTTLQQNVTSRTTALLVAVTGAWTSIRSSVADAVAGLLSAVGGAFESIQSTVTGVQDRITAYLLDQWTKAVPGDIRAGLQEVGDLLVARWNQFKQDVGDRMDAIATAVKNGWNAVSEVTGRVLGVVRGVVTAAWTAISTAVGAALGAIQQVVADGWAVVQAATETITAAVGRVVSDAWQAIKTSILTPLGEAVAQVQAGWTAVLEAVTTALGSALTAVIEFGAGLLKSLGDLVGQTLEQARAVGQAIIDGVKDAIRSGAGAIADLIAQLVRDAIDAAKKTLGAKSPSREFYKIGESVTQGFAAGIASTAQTAIGAAVRLAEAVVAAAADAAPHWHAVGADLIARFRDGIVDNTDAVLTAIGGFSAQAMAALEALRHWIGDAHSGWIGDVAAKRTELLRIFNFAAYLRGEGTKVIPELQDLTNTYIDNVEHAVATAVGQLEKLAKDYQAAVLAARAEAQKQVMAVISEADTKVAELNEQRSLARRLQAQKDAFAEMQRAQKENFDRQQQQLQDALRTQEQVYRIAFQAQLKLGRVGTDAAPGVTAAQSALDSQTELLRIQYEASRDLGRATTADQAAEITKRAADATLALSDRIAEEAYLAAATKELRLQLQREQIEAEKAQALQALADQQAEEVYVREHTATLRNEIATREAAFNAIVAEQSRVFEARLDQEAFDRQIAQIYAERDERIAAINQALKEKEALLAANLETERQAILDNLQTELADLQREYIDKVIEAFHHAQVDISDFIGTINEDLKRQTQAVADQVLDLIGQIRGAKQEMGDTPQYAPRPPVTLPDTLPRSDLIPGVVRLPASTDPTQTTKQYVVNVYPQQATLDEAEIGRVLQRMVLLGG